MLTCSGCGEALTLDTWLQHAVLLRVGHPCAPKAARPALTSIWAGEDPNRDADCECGCCHWAECNCADQPPGERCDCQPCLVTLALAERVGA